MAKAKITIHFRPSIKAKAQKMADAENLSMTKLLEKLVEKSSGKAAIQKI